MMKMMAIMSFLDQTGLVKEIIRGGDSGNRKGRARQIAVHTSPPVSREWRSGWGRKISHRPNYSIDRYYKNAIHFAPEENGEKR